MNKPFIEDIEDLRKELHNIFLELCKSLKIDKLLNWLNNYLGVNNDKRRI